MSSPAYGMFVYIISSNLHNDPPPNKHHSLLLTDEETEAQGVYGANE